MAQITSAGAAMKELLSTAEAVDNVLCRGNLRATKFQLQVQLDSERKDKNELQSVVDELKQAKEQADAERIKHQQDLRLMYKEQEIMKKCQQSCNALIEQMMSKGPFGDGALQSFMRTSANSCLFVMSS